MVENNNFEKLIFFKENLNSNQYIKPNILNITIYNLKKGETDYLALHPRIIIPAIKFPDKIKSAIKKLFEDYPKENVNSKIEALERQAAKKIKELNIQPNKKGDSNPKSKKIELLAKCGKIKKTLEIEVYFNYNGIFFGDFILKD